MINPLLNSDPRDLLLPERTAPAAVRPPTRSETLDALDAAITEHWDTPWARVLLRARHHAEHLAGFDTALTALAALSTDPGDDRRPRWAGRFADGAVPAAAPHRHGLFLGFGEAFGLIERDWEHRTWQYVHLAQAAVDALAHPDGAFLDERDINGRMRAEGPYWPAPADPAQPEHVYLPAELTGPVWDLVRVAERWIDSTENAARDAYDMSTVEDDETGEIRDYTPEHAIDAVAELDDEAAAWPAAVGAWADAVFHAIATHRADLGIAGGTQ